jgi:hypothetical protein
VDISERLKVIEKEAALLRRGISLALMREKVPSYHMELKAVLETVDIVIGQLGELKEALRVWTAGSVPAITSLRVASV